MMIPIRLLSAVPFLLGPADRQTLAARVSSVAAASHLSQLEAADKLSKKPFLVPVASRK